MTTLDGEPLFGSGPTRIEPGDLRLRHVEQSTPGQDGSTLHTTGRAGRPITQRGTLTADDLPTLRARITAIEAMLDGCPRTLADPIAGTWSNVVMLTFRPSAVQRVGPRLAVDYDVRYLQVVPTDG